MKEEQVRGRLRHLCLFLTRAEVTFDNHLVLLLIPSSDDQVVFCADEPQELLEPVNQGRDGREYFEHFGADCWFLWRLTNRLSGLSEWWSQSEPLSAFSEFFSLQTSLPWTIWKQKNMLKYRGAQTFSSRLSYKIIPTLSAASMVLNSFLLAERLLS